MTDHHEPLRPEDYVEPQCLLCGEPYGAEPKIQAIPQQRVVQRLDEYMSRRDYDAAERHLLYWLEEAKLGRDLRGELMVRNELIGHFRKVSKRDEAFEQIESALALLKTLDFETSVSAATTYVNSATALSAFGEQARALELFRKAKALYESIPSTRAHLLGGLYNNMALSCVALGRYAEAHGLFDQAMTIMGSVPGGVLEQAITCLNRADAFTSELGAEAAEEKVSALLDQAYDLLRDDSAPHDGYYAFVCEKCAPTFSYYGYFLAAEELEAEAKKIYERS